VNEVGTVHYAFVRAHATDLDQMVREINECKDKIVSVTQNGNYYTIFYEARGNEQEGG
jgi:hypothetical protein